MYLPDNTVRPVQIVYGSSTTEFISPNTFVLTLPRSGFTSGKDEVCLKSMTVYYSWDNISAQKNNNAFSYNWLGTNYPVYMDHGIFQYSEIMNYLRQVMDKNNHYLVNENGERQYYINLIVNPQLYCLSLIVTPLPSALPAGWTNPGIDLVAAAGYGPQLVIPDSKFAALTGYAAGTYPAAPMTTVYNLNSGIPQITDVSSINVLCNLVDNSGFNLSSDVLSSFVVPPGQAPGSLISLQPYNPDWTPMKKSRTFETISVSLVDQMMKPLVIRDPSGFVAILNLRRRS